MEIKHEQFDEFIIIHLIGDLDVNNVKLLKDEFDLFIEKSNKFIFNLKELEFMDSTGMGMLVSILKMIESKSGKMRITDIQKRPRLLFDLTRGNLIFDIYDQLEDAKIDF